MILSRNGAACLLIICALAVSACVPRIREASEPVVVPPDAAYLDASNSIQVRVDDLLSRMTIADLAAQMIFVEQSLQPDPRYLVNSPIGGLAALGTQTPGNVDPRGYPTAAAYRAWIDSFRAAFAASPLHIPPMVISSASHGLGLVRGAVIYPHALGLGFAGNPDLTRRLSAMAAREARAVGIDALIGPRISILEDPRWGDFVMGYSSDASVVAAQAGAVLDGYSDAGVAGFLQGFVGDSQTYGGWTDGSVLSLPAELFSRYQSVVSPLASRMAGVSLGSHKIAGMDFANSKYLAGDAMTALGLEGIVLMDSKLLETSDLTFNEKYRIAIEAGHDGFILRDGWDFFINLMVRLNKEGMVTRERLEASVRKILTLKMELGLFDDAETRRPPADSVGSDESVALAREAVRSSAVLLSNKGALPLRAPVKTLHVAGWAASNVGAFCGPDTLLPEGFLNQTIPGQSFLDGLEEGAGSLTVVYHGDRLDPEKLANESPEDSAILLVLAEIATGTGLKADRRYLGLYADDWNLVQDAASSGLPVIVLLVGSRPLAVDALLDVVDSVIFVPYPGNEAGALADLVYGKAPFTGRLSIPWPEMGVWSVPTESTAPEDPLAHPRVLFPAGYGLAAE